MGAGAARAQGRPLGGRYHTNFCYLSEGVKNSDET